MAKERRICVDLQLHTVVAFSRFSPQFIVERIPKEIPDIILSSLCLNFLPPGMCEM